MSLGDLGDSVSYAIFGSVAQMASEGKEVFPLAIGEPSFPTPPRIIEAATDSMKRGETHYVSSYGTPEVRDAVRGKARRKNKINAEVQNTIFLTTKLSVYASVLATCKGEGNVLIPDPGYFYEQPVRLTGSKPVRYRLADDYALDIDEVKKKTTSGTRAIIVNSPSNPTGRVLRRSELDDLLQHCKSRGIALISDESYEDLTYGVDHVSVGSLEPAPETVVSLFSLSKSFSMTGWRAGYVVASEGVVNLLNRFVEHTESCFPPFIQAASAFALRNGSAYTRRFRDELQVRRDLMESHLERSTRVRFQKAEGAFYSFPSIEAKVKSLQFCTDLLEATGVAVLPGSIFGKSGERHIRISFAAPRPVIEEGVSRLVRFLERLPR